MPDTMTVVKMLIVEDDRDDSQLTQDLLSEAKRARFAITAVFTLQEALTALQKSRYDVMILDYRLPDGDGVTFLQQIKHQHFGVPAVMITSHGDRNLQALAIEAGAAEYLEKGAITTDLLERTCIYAIGLHEKQTRNGSGPGIGVLVEQLVSLTRESIQAQTASTQEFREFRRELAERVTDLKTTTKEQHDEVMAKQTEVCTEVQHLAKFRWLLDWVVQHPVGSVIIFLCLLAAAIVAIMFLQTIDLELLKKLIELRKVAALSGVLGWIC